MRTVSRIAPVAAVLGTVVGACLAHAQDSTYPPKTYTVNSQTCQINNQKAYCGNCNTTYRANSECALGYECIGFQCTEDQTVKYTACTGGGNESGGCLMNQSMTATTCKGCMMYVSIPPECIVSESCGSPGCSGTGMEPTDGDKCAPCVAG